MPHISKYRALRLYSKDRVKNQLNYRVVQQKVYILKSRFHKNVGIKTIQFSSIKEFRSRFFLEDRKLTWNQQKIALNSITYFKSWFLFGVSLSSAQLSGCICMMNMVKSGCKAGGTCKKQLYQNIYKIEFQSTIKY